MIIGILFGHGHVYPRPDGMKARCGGPGICTECSLDAAAKSAKEQPAIAKRIAQKEMG